MDEAIFPKHVLFALRASHVIGGRLMPRRTALKMADSYLTPMNHPAPAREQEVAATAQRFTATNGLTGFRWGEPNKPSILLIHGWSGRATQFCAYVQPLLDAGYQVIAVDLPGHGLSAAVNSGTEGAATFPPHTRDRLLELGDEFAPFEAVIAHSFGAACTLWACGFGLDTKKVVALGCPTHYIHREFAEFVRAPKGCTEQFVAEISRRMNFPADEIDIQDIINNIGLEMIKPTLFVHGRNDVDVPFSHAERNSRLVVGSELYALDDCNHRKILWDPRAVTKVLDWIAS